MKLWYDCEFLENGSTIELISIGLVAEDGREYYAVRSEIDQWIPDGSQELHARISNHRWLIANEVREFILAEPGPELWGWYTASDFVALYQLWGRLVDLPKGVPMWTNDLKQECERLGNPQVPQQASGEHNALEDARHNREIDRFLSEIAYAKGVERGYGT